MHESSSPPPDQEQQLTRVLAIRHGETDWNAATRIQGHVDIPLNERGRWQADRLAQALADEHFDAIYASDLQRALHTAQAVAARRGAAEPVLTDTGLRERGFGEFEGQTFHDIEQRWPEHANRWRRRDPQSGPPGGEVLSDFYERCVRTLTRLAQAHPGQSIAVVAHGGVLDCLYRLATRLELQAPRSWQLGNASINRLLYTPQGFTLVGWSDIGHLDDEALDETSDGTASLTAKPGAAPAGTDHLQGAAR
jgi:2,3-bisphosphoglycerate-dependent phosphoglycerate mutase